MTKTYTLTQTLTLLEQQEEAKEYDTMSIQAVHGGKNEKEPVRYTINNKTVIQAERIALEQRKPVNTTFYRESMMGTVFVGETKMNTKYLVNETDSGYPTNRIEKIYKINEDFIIITTRAVYIVHGTIKKRKQIRN